jgi:anti-sigma-K factor RskA
MTCEQLHDVILEVAAGTAGAAEARALRAHLSAGCPVCAARLAEAEAIGGQLPLALPPVAPSASVKVRLMERIAADPRVVVPFPTERARPPAARSPWLPAAVAAGIAAAIVGVAVYVPLARDRDALRADLSRLDGELRVAAETVRVLRSPSVQVVSLGGGEPQPGARGRIFWDRGRGEWRFYAAELRPPGAGRTYELWLINDRNEKIPAGTFGVDARGEGELHVSLPAGAGTIVAAAVTDEPEGGVPQPTGSIQLVGSIQKSNS